MKEAVLRSQSQKRSSKPRRKNKKKTATRMDTQTLTHDPIPDTPQGYQWGLKLTWLPAEPELRSPLRVHQKASRDLQGTREICIQVHQNKCLDSNRQSHLLCTSAECLPELGRLPQHLKDTQNDLRAA